MILPLNLRLTAHLFCRPQNQISKSQMKFVVNTRPLKKTHAPISLNRLSVSLFSLSKEIKTKSRNKEINKEITPRSRLCIRWLVVLPLAPAPCSCSNRLQFRSPFVSFVLFCEAFGSEVEQNGTISFPNGTAPCSTIRSKSRVPSIVGNFVALPCRTLKCSCSTSKTRVGKLQCRNFSEIHCRNTEETLQFDRKTAKNALEFYSSSRCTSPSQALNSNDSQLWPQSSPVQLPTKA